MPDNSQIDRVLDYGIKTSPVDLKRLSPEGKVMIDDVRCVSPPLMRGFLEGIADSQRYHGDHANDGA